MVVETAGPDRMAELMAGARELAKDPLNHSPEILNNTLISLSNELKKALDKAACTEGEAWCDDSGGVCNGCYRMRLHQIDALESQMPREEVVWFAKQMEVKLAQNDHKSHWTGEQDYRLLAGLDSEIRELKQELIRGPNSMNADPIIEEAADVANMAMMIADKARKAQENARRSR